MPSRVLHSVFFRRFAGVLAIAGTLALTGFSRWSSSKPEDTPAARLRVQANKEFAAGHHHVALGIYQQAYLLASNSGDQHERLKDLSNRASVKRADFQYRSALEDYQNALKIAIQYGSNEENSLIEANLASLYILLGDLDAASQAGEKSLRLAGDSELHGLKCEVLVCMAVIRAKQGQSGASLSYFRAAILAADRLGKPQLMAKDWSLLGQELLYQGDLEAAERALSEAYRIRNYFPDGERRTSLQLLAWLKLEQGDLKSASSLMDSALRMPAGDGFQAWMVMYLRGRILQAEGNNKDALIYMKKALVAAREFQEQAAPDGVPAQYAQQRLKQLYSDVVKTSLSEDRLGIEGFQATEEDRAIALRQTLAASSTYVKKAPPEYWAVLEQLRREQAQALEGNNQTAIKERIGALRSTLSGIEGKAGFSEILAKSRSNLESNTAETTLRRIQRGLLPDEALLSFHVGDGVSALWAVTRDQVDLYRLAPEANLSSQIKTFRAAVQGHKAERDELGEILYRELFGRLSPAFQEKTRWVISAEDSFFEVPLAALVVERIAGQPVYLVERRNLVYTPSAAMLSAEPRVPDPGGFVGIGDGIYNTADDRWVGVRGAGFLSPMWSWSKPQFEMARLAGSAKELEACSRRWNQGGGGSLLRGRDATRQALKTALNGRVEVLHIASHFVASATHSEDTLIYLGLDAQGQPELVNEKDVAMLHAGNATVVMSGCSSGDTKSIAMAGVLGLTRAWMIAGARAVIGARWPTVDDTGDLFTPFYEALYSRRSDPARMRAVADSLRIAQVKMLQTKSWRSDPAYWGAFYVVGKD